MVKIMKKLNPEESIDAAISVYGIENQMTSTKHLKILKSLITSNSPIQMLSALHQKPGHLNSKRKPVLG